MPEGYYHLTRDLRSQIYALKSTGLSQAKIALHLGCSASTVSREIKRNTGGRGYRYQQADEMAQQRRSQASQQPKKMTAALTAHITTKLLKQWSPEQISGRLKREGLSISHESIYRFVWRNKREGGEIYKQLRHRSKPYNRRSSSKAGRGCIPNRKDISERPQIVESKIRLGDWEGDTVMGAGHQGAILTYVDRSSKLSVFERLARRTAKNVAQATVKCFKRLPVHTITYDNGKEFCGHQEIAKNLKTTCYFARPYHSWERGLNEHTNGLLRQYLPKSSDLSKVTHKELKQIENALNNRPRKVLQYKTPFEVFFAQSVIHSNVALQC